MKGITSTVASVDGQWLWCVKELRLPTSANLRLLSLDGTIVAWKHKHTKYYTRITNKQSPVLSTRHKKNEFNPVHDAITVTGCS